MPTKDHYTLLNACPVLDWIDRELVDTYQLTYGEENKSDILLELRHHFSSEENQSSLNKLVGGFYQILPRLEEHFYLFGYRIRQWFSLNFALQFSDPLSRVAIQHKPLCQTLRSLESERKTFFEECDYAVPYHDIRWSVVMR